MPSTLQERPSEGQLEVTQFSEQISPENFEYDEEELGELADQSIVQVEAGESRVLASAEKRMENSMGLDNKKARSIFTSGGFADRIKNIRDKISNLTRNTKEKITTMASIKTELGSEQEVFAGKTRKILTLDKYIAKRKNVSGMELIRDKARLAQLKLKGLRNPEKILGFINYLEEKAADYEMKTVLVKDSEKEIEEERYKQEGYYVRPGRDSGKKSKTSLTISRDVPFHFDMRDAKYIANIVGTETDPVEFFERLQSLGYKIRGNEFTLYSSEIVNFLYNPAILEYVKKLQLAEGKISLPRDQYLFDGGQEGRYFASLAEVEARKGDLNEASIKNLSTISEIIGHPIRANLMEAWTTIANDSETVQLLLLARENGSRFSEYDDSTTINNLNTFKNSSIAGDVIALVKEGFDPKGFALDQMGSYSLVPSPYQVIDATRELKFKPAFKEFVKSVAAEVGVKPTTEPKDFGKFLICFSRPKEAVGLLKTAKEFGIISQNDWSESTLERIFRSSGIAEIVGQPAFLDFLSALKKAGYKPSVDDIFPTDGHYSQLLEANKNANFKELIAKQENIELAQQVKLFGSSNWGSNINAFENLMVIPDASQSLRVLGKKFDYDCGTVVGDDLQSLAFLLSNQKLMEGLMQPETESLFLGLKNVGYKFKPHQAESLIKLSTDQKMIGELSDPETTNFIKEVNAYATPDLIKALTNTEPASRPVIIRLVKEFYYSPTCFDGSLNDIGKIRELSKRPEILDTVMILHKHDIHFNPLESLERIKTIIDKNLLEVFIQCKISSEVQDWIIKNPDLVKIDSKEKISGYFSEMLKYYEGKPIRDRQMIRGELVGILFQEKKYGALAEMGGVSAEVEESVEKVKQFIEKYKVSGKGMTVATLLLMREYREGEDFATLLSKVEKRLTDYERLLERQSFQNIPQGLRASIGMEYEITNSTASGYSEVADGHYLSNDMKKVANFANVGQGKDAVFEIATKPTDNPYLMLLEMQLLQDLEFIDLNFKRPGYELGSRGYHLTIGGERGIDVNRNSNFLQNMLVMSGWGGVNAGRKVDRLSSGRSLNIRQRNSHDTKVVFENTKPAVEFRSLSLDAWEPFERSVETAYNGAVAVQAIARHAPKLDVNNKNFGDLTVEDPEQFYKLLTEKNLIHEPINNTRTKQIIFEWARLQRGILGDLADHNTNFLQNEMYGIEDDSGNWIDAQDSGGASNKNRFIAMAGTEKDLVTYAEKTQIESEALFFEAQADFANKLTAITNLFIKSTEESGGDAVNASSILDTTKVGRVIEDGDPQSKYMSFFDTHGKTREGYYYVQGGSEKMIIHKAQMRLLEFNKRMQDIIS